jgi:hypothetical protein
MIGRENEIEKIRQNIRMEGNNSETRNNEF